MKDSAEFAAFLDALIATLESKTTVVGLVLLGSTADRHRADEWSDHDFFVVTEDDAQEAFRADLSWLPNADDISLSVRETDHGLKVVYANGHVLEFAVFDRSELLLAEANAWAAPIDRGGISERMTAIAGRPKARDGFDSGRALGLFVSLLVIGVGRARRGELLTAGQSIRTLALGHLLATFAHERESPLHDRLDDLDPFRRFEQSYPELGARIGAATEGDPETAARSLLEIAEAELSLLPSWPTAGVAAVRARLGWN